MSRSTIRSLDVDRLREIIDMAKDTSSASAVDVTFAVLDRIREMIGTSRSGPRHHEQPTPWAEHLQDLSATAEQLD